MHYPEFAESYRRIDQGAKGLTDHQLEIMRTPRNWMNTFDLMLTNHLRQRQPDVPYVEDQLASYREWSGWDFEVAKAELTNGDADNLTDTTRRELKFHSLNRAVLQSWYTLLLNQEVTEEAILDMQIDVALEAVPVARSFYTGSDAAPPFDQSKNSMYLDLSLSDGLIAGLEATHSLERTVVVPATQRFMLPRNSGLDNENRASDFIALDTLKRSARGYKITKSSKGSEKYDKNVVTTISAMHDLGNESPVTIGSSRNENRPGHLAMGVVATHIDATGTHDRLGLAVAKTVTLGRASRLYEVADRLQKQFAEDLTK